MLHGDTTQWANAGLSPSPAAMRDHLLTGLLQEGAPIPGDYPQLLEDSGIRFSGDWFALAELHVVAVDAYAYIRGLGQTAYSEAHLVVNLLELYRKLFEGSGNIFVFKIQSELMCLVCGTDREQTEQLLTDGVETMLDAADHMDGLRLFASASGAYPGFDGIRKAKEQVRQLGEYRILHVEVAPLLSYNAVESSGGSNGERMDIQKEQQLLGAFKTGHYREACGIFTSLFEAEYLALAQPMVLLKHKCAQFQQALVSCTQGILEEDITQRVQTFEPERRLLEATTYPELRAQMEHFLGYLNDMILAARKEHSGAWIMDVKDYIRTNYTDPELNVNSVADAFGKNPSYLSRSFLRLTGTSLLDYIHFYRIQEAKILIGRGETLANVATAVGYSSVLTMSRAFKRYEGITPGKLKS